ncbi:MAG: hypothetical protein ACKOX6_01860 [Bdellovibrio sp.]
MIKILMFALSIFIGASTALATHEPYKAFSIGFLNHISRGASNTSIITPGGSNTTVANFSQSETNMVVSMETGSKKQGLTYDLGAFAEPGALDRISFNTSYNVFGVGLSLYTIFVNLAYREGRSNFRIGPNYSDPDLRIQGMSVSDQGLAGFQFSYGYQLSDKVEASLLLRHVEFQASARNSSDYIDFGNVRNDSIGLIIKYYFNNYGDLPGPKFPVPVFIR